MLDRLAHSVDPDIQPILNGHRGFVKLSSRVSWPGAEPPTCPTVAYRGYRFPAEVIAHSVWLDLRFHLSFRDVQDLLAERGIIVSHEAIRHWCYTSGPPFQPGCGAARRALGTTGTSTR
jgi:hypothetical protein